MWILRVLTLSVSIIFHKKTGEKTGMEKVDEKRTKRPEEREEKICKNDESFF